MESRITLSPLKWVTGIKWPAYEAEGYAPYNAEVNCLKANGNYIDVLMI
jgi:hypothetical protein